MSSFKPPTDTQVNEALRRILTPQLRQAFFDGLKNPLWVEPLAKAGMFDNPPEPEMTDDGLIRDFYWPEIDYLKRVAPKTPKAVVDILLKLNDSNNAWVHGAVFSIGASIPSDETARLKPLIKNLNEIDFGRRSDPREIVALAVNLLRGGQQKVGKWVANLIFRPSPSEIPHRPNLTIKEHWYQEGLPRVVDTFDDANDGLKTVLPWLEEYERHSGRVTDSYDWTFMSHDSIRHTIRRRSAEQSLIDAVFDLATKSMISDPRVAKATLSKSHMVLTRKITLSAVSEALGGNSDRTPTENHNLLAIAAELVADSEFREDSCRIQFGELARQVAKHSPSVLEPLISFIATGPQMELDQLRERLRRDEEDTPDELQERVEAVLDTWKHRWLSAVGSDALPTVLKPILLELDARFGAIESPLSPEVLHSSWCGPNSPISTDEMSVMSSAELATHLESWHDVGDGWGPGPSHEGQARELSAFIATSPKALEGIDDLADRLRPTYLRAILEGWEASVKADFDIDWNQSISLVKGILTHSDASSFPVEGGRWDDDVDYRGAKKAAVGLLEELVKKRDASSMPAEARRRFADLLINANDQSDWTEYDSISPEHGMDPLTLSINWQWPIRVRGLLNLMLYGPNASWYEAAREAFEREITRPDSKGASRAVIGERLGHLLSVVPDWIKPRLGALIGSTDGITRNQQIVLTTAMAVHYYSSALYDSLAPSMIAAIRSTQPLVAGWQNSQSDPLQRIGEWVIDAIIFGHKTLSDSVAAEFFATADPKIRGAAVGHIAWQFGNAESVDDVIRDRLADLWDTRMDHVREHPEDHQELLEFYWFVSSGKFDVSWWLPRLKEGLGHAPELAHESHMISKQIASSADVDPSGAFQVVRLLLTNREDASTLFWVLSENAVPMVIARAVASGHEHLKQEAILFMNELGEQGNPALEKKVQAVLNGEITQDDVKD
ncbi:hypothetical protein [Glutamicibacter arilaitensis]|uniref:hypothetical protein n=1 Tax=Glutamicibacter arilaitensis TaxID=256701 RepID=UPI003FD47AF7